MKILTILVFCIFCIFGYHILFYNGYKKPNSIIVTDTTIVGDTLQFNYKFKKSSSNIIGYKYHIIENDSIFEYYKTKYKHLIEDKFYPSHLIGVKEIIITDSIITLNDSTYYGLCFFADTGDSYIIVTIADPDSDKTILHELCHAMQYSYYGSAFEEIREEWLKTNKFVTKYSIQNIDEDFAETGSYYLTGNYNSSNKKYDLFKYFMDRIAGKA